MLNLKEKLPVQSNLGETLTGNFNDGTNFYLEKISEFPNRVAILIIGYKNCFKFSTVIEVF